MSNEPFVSIIMSEYNTDIKLLKNSIRSILHQSYNNFEFIIVDDCGKNNLNEIVKEFNDSRIVVLKNDVNLGLVASLNKALSYSKGKYIARMDTDDFSYENRLEKQVEFLENHSEIDVVAGNADYYDENGIWGESNFSGKVDRNDFLRGCPIMHPTVMMRSEVIKNNKGYLNYNRCEDYATWIKMFLNGKSFFNMNDKLIKYHLSELDFKKNNIKNNKGYLKLLRTLYRQLSPSFIQFHKMYIKSIISSILPYKYMYKRKLNSLKKRR